MLVARCTPAYRSCRRTWTASADSATARGSVVPNDAIYPFVSFRLGRRFRIRFLLFPQFAPALVLLGFGGTGVFFAKKPEIEPIEMSHHRVIAIQRSREHVFIVWIEKQFRLAALLLNRGSHFQRIEILGGVLH